MSLDIVYTVTNLNADDIRRIQIEVLYDLELIVADDVDKINFIDPVAKDEILSRKRNIIIEVVEPPATV